ncbi:MAG TPA: HEAT repeat domain-containing protein [Vicinamibacterales bacterium]|jgi:cyclophilin family peptidyl-prolyl cis-trans isomerase
MHKVSRNAIVAVVIALTCASCKTVPVAPTVPVITWEQKLAAILRLEDQRILREPNPPPPVVLRPATKTTPALVAPPLPTDLVRMLNDDEARVRRRAALAIGRVGLSEGIEPLTKLLDDEEVEVKQMAAFALGLIGDEAARPVLLEALKSPQPIVQGRAAEALGQIGNKADGPAISAMVQTHVRAGVLNGLMPDDIGYPLAPAIEAARLGIYAITRLGDYDSLAAAVLANGKPVSTWWPIAYALQRVGDPRAASALTGLLATPGRFTAAFAARGLGNAKAPDAATALRRIVTEQKLPQAVIVQSIRALATMRDTGSQTALRAIVLNRSADATVRLEAMTALAAVVTASSIDLLLDLASNSTPAIRGAALGALARVDPDHFVSTLASLDPDRDWTVRVALANALGSLPADRAMPRLTVMLQDSDRRVIPAVLAALASTKAPGADRLLLERLKAPDVVIRGAAATALGDLKATSAVQPLIEAYRSGASDPEYGARASMLGALAKIDPAAARPVLVEALKDRDWAVRIRAAELLRQQKVVESPARPAAPAPAHTREFQTVVAPRYSPHAYIETEKGTIEIELAVIDAPLTTANFMTLARKGFFNGIAFHRIVPDFVVQGGDPRGDGEGGPGYAIRDEINQRPYLRGTVGMALDWKDTGGSQFFITHSPQPHLDARYTVFGHVVGGMEVVDRLVPWDVIKTVKIWDGISPQ